jgi:hypothetical protein
VSVVLATAEVALPDTLDSRMPQVAAGLVKWCIAQRCRGAVPALGRTPGLR